MGGLTTRGRREDSALDPRALGARLIEQRRRRGWSQQELARRAHISPSHLSMIENGRRNASPEMLGALAEALDCSVEYLLTGRGDNDTFSYEVEMNFARLSLLNGDAAAAADRYRDIRSRAATAGRDDEAAAALLGLSVAREVLGDVRGALDGFQQLADMPELPATVDRAELMTMLCRLYLNSGDLAHAITVGEQALRDLSNEPATESSIKLACMVIGCHQERGDLTRAQMLIDDVMPMAERLGSPVARASTYWNAGLVAAERGDIEEAYRLTVRALAIYGELDARWSIAMLRRNAGWLLLLGDAPDPAGARALLEPAFAELLEVGSPSEAAEAEADISRCYLLEGDVERAMLLARSATDRAAGGAVIELSKAQIALGDALVVAGELAEAAVIYRDAAQGLDAAGAVRQAVAAWHRLASALRQMGRVGEAVEAYERLAGAAAVLMPPMPSQPTNQ